MRAATALLLGLGLAPDFLAAQPTLASGSRGTAVSRPFEGPPVGSAVDALAEIRITASSRQLGLASGESVVLTSKVPLPVRETVVVVDAAGTVVRTLVDALRAPGTYEDSWDGKGADGGRLRDGLYRWVATFTSGDQVRTIDLTAEKDGDAEVKSHPEYPGWDPFEGVPLKFSHRFDRPGEIALVFSRETYYVHLSCEAPKFFCRFLEGYQPAGDFTYEWAGVDDSGAYRDDIRGIFVISHHEELSKNAIVVHGGRPVVMNVRVQPTRYLPGLSPQEISFELRMLRGECARAVVTVMNLESRSILRTIPAGESVPGASKVSWDGRGDNGFLVAPGRYLIAVTATDSLGQSSRGEILTQVDY